MTHDYKRNGTTLFAALNVLDGTVIGRNMKHHRSVAAETPYDVVQLDGLQTRAIAASRRFPAENLHLMFSRPPRISGSPEQR
jgi:hypothetical protein